MSPTLAKTGFDTWTSRVIRRMRRRHNETCVTILSYQSVSHTETIFNANGRHAPAEFEQQMEYLAENYSLLSLGEFLDRLARRDPPQRGVVVTLDGGYADAVRQALPIAHRRRIPLTVFPATAVIGNRDLLWQHKLAWLAAQGFEARIFDAFAAEGYPPRLENQHAEEYVRINFQRNTPDLLESLVKSAGQSGAALAAAHRPYLEPEEIAEADRELIEFANHTHTHPILSTLSSEQQRDEIVTARDTIHALTGYDPIALAYPFGLKRHYNADSTRIACETGHRAVLDRRGRINRPQADAFDLSRKPATTEPQDAFVHALDNWPDNADVV